MFVASVACRLSQKWCGSGMNLGGFCRIPSLEDDDATFQADADGP